LSFTIQFIITMQTLPHGRPSQRAHWVFPPGHAWWSTCMSCHTVFHLQWNLTIIWW
jgi:hypothetical protein